MSVLASESDSNTAYTHPFKNVGTWSSLSASIHSLAAAQTSNHFNHDLASSPWSGSDRVMPRPAMSSQVSAPILSDNMLTTTDYVNSHRIQNQE